MPEFTVPVTTVHGLVPNVVVAVKELSVPVSKPSVSKGVTTHGVAVEVAVAVRVAVLVLVAIGVPPAHGLGLMLMLYEAQPTLAEFSSTVTT